MCTCEPPRSSSAISAFSAPIGPPPAFAGAMISTLSWPAASGALVPDAMPPSTYRRPATVAGGHMPGIAQLAITASTSGTPLSRSKTRSSPVPASTAAIRSRVAGQSGTVSRLAMMGRRSASEGVRVASEIAPIRARNRVGFRQCRTSVPANRTSVPRPSGGATSDPGPAVCAAYCSSSGT
jgi:hypothetical protein